MPLPDVSVVMPVRNEERTVEAALRAVLAQDYPRLIDIVVAEGRSTDNTRTVLEQMAATDDRIVIVDNPSGTTPTGLNAAIEACKGDVVVRVDARAILPDGYIARAVEILADTGADNVGGMQDAQGEGLLHSAIALAQHLPIGVGDARFRRGGPPGPVDTVFLGVFRRDVFDRVGLFDEALLRNQDADLNHRIRASGGTVYFHPDLRVIYEPRRTLGALWRQYFASGAWKRETFRRRPGEVRWRQAVPPLFVLGLAGSAVLAATPLRAFAAVLPGAYAAALLGSTLWALARRRGPSAVLLPVVLPVMHVAWGLGFLVGRAR